MTLNAKIGVLRIFGDFGLRDTIQERIAPKLIEININNLRMKFSTLNVDFNGLSLDFLSLSGTPEKVVILPLLSSLS